MNKYGSVEEAIPFLTQKRSNWRKGKTKIKNPKEVAEFAKINSPERAARVYGISERQVYRYM